jgi:TFIIF-interacting CTD phosphatase-like protein
MARHAKLLVLDLDETLIHARDHDDPDLAWPPHATVGGYRMYRRPGVEQFLATVLDRFEAVGVWTAASNDYAAFMLDSIVDRERLRFVYTRERCTQRRDLELAETYILKDLAKLKRFGYGKGQILVVDDTPRNLQRSYANLVAIPPFHGDPTDARLAQLLEYLEELGPLGDVRPVNKLRWWAR